MSDRSPNFSTIMTLFKFIGMEPRSNNEGSSIRFLDGSPVLLCPGETMQVRMKSFVLQRRAEADASDVCGSVCITNYRIFFIDQAATTCHVSFATQVVEKLVKQRNLYEFLCKDFRIVRFRMEAEARRTAEENEAVWKQAYFAFSAFIFPKPPNQVFAYHSQEVFTTEGDASPNGGKIYDAKQEYERLGLDDRMRLTTANSEYQLCDTYPRVLIVPASITDEELIQIAQFRSRKRIPVVSWHYAASGAVLLRSAQPLVGVTRSRCKEDEKLLETVAGSYIQANSSEPKKDEVEIRTMTLAGVLLETPVRIRRTETGNTIPVSPEKDSKASSNSSKSDLELLMPPPSPGAIRVASASQTDIISSPKGTPPASPGRDRVDRPLHILDARPLMNAGAMKIKGAGFETIEHYKHCRLEFLGIENIHVMRKSMHRLRSLVVRPDDLSSFWTAELATTRWLEYIGVILASALRVTSLLEAGNSVLVHCSDGWDRTCQLVSLAMLMMDPYYRTRRGFMVLIEKEWLSFGHRFADRAMSAEHADKKEFSPVFLQFIDSTWQIWQQYPDAFEFNTDFLETIIEHAWSCRFGTFLGNCEKERNELQHLPSLWTYIENVTDRYMNPYYIPGTHVILRPVASLRCLQLWTSYYLQHDQTIPPERRSCARDAWAMSAMRKLRTLESNAQRRPSRSGPAKERSAVPYGGTPGLIRRAPLLASLEGEDTSILGQVTQLDDAEIETISESSSAEDNATDSEDEQQSNWTASPHSFVEAKSSRLSEHLVLSSSMEDSRRDSDNIRSALGPLTPVKWMPDSAVSECSLCGRKFTAMRRKHHCRRCGHIFCYQCTQHTRIIPHVSPKPVRVCVRCFLET